MPLHELSGEADVPADEPQEPKSEPIVLEDIRRLVLEPGDVLVVRVEGAVTMQMAEAITRSVEQYLPGHKVLVLPAGMMDLEVLGREQAPPQPPRPARPLELERRY